ncbi:glucoside xylosyltransferase 1 [Penaeus vannamei]|uniref:glucoside xylosyltransferase 1 n=1 Tax=Penaeus vannamei TaxID=6689 RepID=UPI00387F3E00
MFIRIQRQLRRNPTLVVLVTLTLWWSAACMFVYTARASSFVGNSGISLDVEDEYEFTDGRRTRMHREKLSRRGKYKQVQERVSNFSMDLPKLYLDTRRVEENGLVSEEQKMETKKSKFPENIEDFTHAKRRKRHSLPTKKKKKGRRLKAKPQKRKQIEVAAPPPPENTSTATHPENLASLRTLVTIVCGTQQRPDEYQRNIFGRQLNQTKAMLKSLVYFSTFTAFRIILVTDTVDTYTQVLQQIEDWPANYRSRLHLERAELWTPSSQSDPLLLQRWRPCSWSKLFLLESLPFVDSAVYVDTDILFLAPAEGLWDVLEELEAPQALALGPDPLYDRHKHRRYAGSVGLSAGLMVMDLAALRAFRGKHGNFTQTILYYKNSFENYHDQDTLNVFLADHPDLLHELGARWNFSPSQCLGGVLSCCIETGVAVLHGFDATFVRGIEMVFQVIYERLLGLTLDAGSASDLLRDLEEQFLRVDRLGLESTCKKVWGIQDILLKHIRDLAKVEEKEGTGTMR